MNRPVLLLAAITFLAPLSATAQNPLSLTGMTIFDANRSGNWTGFFGGSFWNTGGGDQSANVYVINGSDLQGPFINHGNGADVGINIPLTNGTYTFTFYGAGGDNFGAWGMNLFFNGNGNSPGISVSAPLNSPAFSPDSLSTMSLFQAAVPGAGTASFTFGATKVTVTAYVFYSFGTFNIDRVGSYIDAPDGYPDHIGQFTIEVSGGCQVNACGPGVTDNCVSLTVGAKPGWPPQTSMDAVFIPPAGMTVANYAHACGFDEFNWQQIFEFVPPPSPFREVGFPPGSPSIPLTAGGGVTFFDPPPRGYAVPNEPLSSYPFYYSNNAALNTLVCASIQTEGVANVPVNALCFHDAPADACLQGGDPVDQATYCGGGVAQAGAALLIKTALVGASQSFPFGQVLTDWEWLDNFNGTADGFIVVASNPGPVDPGSGTGGITITNVNGVRQTPPSVSCAVTPNTLWPPNGRSVLVTESGMITPGTSPIVSAAYAVTDEYGQVQPSGTIALGPGGTYSFGVSLIAARNGNDQNGRTYTIMIGSNDTIGNLGSCSTVVTVAHDQGN